MIDFIGWFIVGFTYWFWLRDVVRPSKRRAKRTTTCHEHEAEEFQRLAQDSEVPGYLLEQMLSGQMLRLRHALHRLAICLIPRYLIGRLP